MVDDPSLVGFGWVLTLVWMGVVLGLVGKSASPPPIAPPAPNPDNTAEQILALQQQCLRLREDLHQQRGQLTADFQDATFEQLQTLLTNYPSARKMANAKPDLPARNLSALFTPLENLLETWGISPIGTAWEQVSYNPQWHQPDREDMVVGEPVYVRFVGYRQGDRILCPAKVSRTLPEVGEVKEL